MKWFGNFADAQDNRGKCHAALCEENLNAQQLSNFLTSLPGGAWAYLAVTIVVFLVLGCILEGLPAILLQAPIMFPIAKKLGIHDVHYLMVVVTAMASA